MGIAILLCYKYDIVIGISLFCVVNKETYTVSMKKRMRSFTGWYYVMYYLQYNTPPPSHYNRLTV